MPLSEKEYLLRDGEVCPYCGAECCSFEYGGFTSENDSIYQDVTCTQCDNTWDDVFKLIGLSLKIVPDSACSFGKCDGQNACQKVGMCRYKHHKEGGYKTSKSRPSTV